MADLPPVNSYSDLSKEIYNKQSIDRDNIRKVSKNDSMLIKVGDSGR